MPGQLFTHYFLTDGIRTTPEWKSSSSGTAEFRSKLATLYENFQKYHQPNEAVTEDDFIIPVLELLGWSDHLPQQSSGRNEDIPDYLLFADVQSKARAAVRTNPEDRYMDATTVVENKRFGLPLDSRDKNDGSQRSTPHGQILRYLSAADTASDGNIRWGILTNGAQWRLYDRRTSPRATAYFEADLGTLLESYEDTLLFRLLFGRHSFTPHGGEKTGFLEAALAGSRSYEERVAQDLSSVVFEEVFPSLIQALTNASTADLGTAREAALIFLYRMLFLLYAEDRGLLPINDPRYERYGLRNPVRENIAQGIKNGTPFSGNASSYYDHLMDLCRMVDQGDSSIGLPPYNGGLFAHSTAPLLEQVRLTDTVIAPIIHGLSHVRTDEGARFVNYRDMSVQQLGSIYERLLEQEPVRDSQGTITVRPNNYARKDSGSYFTPQELVDLIVERTLKPLVEDRINAFKTEAEELKDDDRPIAEQLTDLRDFDPAEAVLELKVLDPAMGSGHFLVTAVDFLADHIAELTEHTPGLPEWLNGEYTSPLVERIDAIRDDIIPRARESGWTLDEAQLTDQTIIRRMVLKRCIYGVDKNPLTVELAKVSLWLHSFTVGAPLSFLDHHLRCGDALVGMRVAEATKELNRLGGLFASPAIAGAEAATDNMQRIEEMSDADISEVRQSASLFQEVEETTANLRNLLDLLNGIRWQTAGMKAKERKVFESPLVNALGEQPAQAYELLTQGPAYHDPESPDEQTSDSTKFRHLWTDARAIADRETFLHWEAAFPGVWRSWQDARPQGGFDAVIGNPPWDRIEQQEVEWFALRDQEVANAATGSLRKAIIKRRLETGESIALQYEQSRQNASELRALVRASGQYPFLSGGRVNLYSLFVERASSLTKPNGMIGLLTPSGIYSDQTAASFFKSISTTGRIRSLHDFENRKIFFKDVHASFKFCALVFGGDHRQFPETECAFFLHATETIKDPDRCFSLTAADFEKVNPNTGTAPIFRTRRDAKITSEIYNSNPVLVRRTDAGEAKAWPVSFKQGLFNMTTDSHLFRTAKALDAEGYYRIDGNRWRKGEAVYLPLYQGRMIQQFDHRANSIRLNPDSSHNPYLSEEVTPEQHQDPSFTPEPQYWVPQTMVAAEFPQSPGYALAFRDIARSTDERTVIACIVPDVGLGNKVPILTADGVLTSACLTANLNSLCLDYVARQKIQSTSLNWYIVEQFPVIATQGYERQFGDKSALDIVLDHVLRLTYTAHDMARFAKDLGYDGPPFIWDEEERRHQRARLDALYFHLYGISREDADYILSTFPIVQREDEARFGTYRTRDLIMGYMNALSVGDTNTTIFG